MSGVLNVFEPGLKRGSEVSSYAQKMGYGSNKKYLYVENQKKGWRVFLRACCFIHSAEDPKATKFVVVKTTDQSAKGRSWEPPKGQTEGKDGLQDPTKPLLSVLEDNLRREIYEEAKIENVQGLKYTGLVVQSTEDNYDENTYFQYHIFSAYVSSEEYLKAQEKFKWYSLHPKVWDRLRKDNGEKDGLSWYNPSSTKLYGRWSPSIVSYYLNNYKLSRLR